MERAFMENADITANWYYDSIDPRGVFYTDSNGLEMIKREVDSYHRRAQANTT